MKWKISPFVWQLLLLYATCSALFLYITCGSSGVFTDDGFFHYRIASEIGLQRPWVDITALPYTVLSARGTDHQWLWHVLIAPVTHFFSDDLTGMKVAIALTGALVPLAIFAFAYQLSLPSPWLVTALALFAIIDLPGRYLLLCAQNIAVVFLLAYIFFLTQQRYLACAIISGLFMLSYHGALILLPVAAIAYVLSIYYRHRADTRILLATVTGLVLGLTLNPWFPDTFRYIYFHVAHKMLAHTTMAVGQEWHSMRLPDSLPQAWIAHLCLLFSLFTIVVRSGKVSSNELPIRLETALMVTFSVFCLALYHYASRFSEYYGPVSILAAALVYRDCLASLAKPFRWSLAMVLLGLLSFKAPQTVKDLAAGGTNDASKYAEANAWLAQHAKPGDIVFNLRWDDFVYLFWKNPQLHYVNGLDPNFLAQGSPEKYDIWATYAIARLPNVPDQAEYIHEHFAAKWIVVDYLYQPLIDALMTDPHAKLVAGSSRSLLFEITE